MSEHRFQQGGPGCRRACIVAMIFGISEGSVCCDHLTIFKKCTKHICSGNMSPGAAILRALPTLSEHEHASKPALLQQLRQKGSAGTNSANSGGGSSGSSSGCSKAVSSSTSGSCRWRLAAASQQGQSKRKTVEKDQ